MRWTRTGLAGLAALAVLAGAGCTAKGPAPGPSASPTPTVAEAFAAGSDGIGDGYYPKAGNGGYDVGHYDLTVRYDPATDVLTGTTVITATATANLTAFNLDFRGMQISKLTVGDAVASARRNGDELTVTPATPIARGSTFTVTVGYAGVPTPYTEDGANIGFLATDTGAVAIGEPDVAASWFPVNDHPRDKATYAITITAPDGLAALANGTRGASTQAAGWTTTTWTVSKPMAPYLATMVIGRYRVHESIHNGLPVILAVDSQLPTQIDTQLARTGEVIDFLASKFGPYPFDALGGIVISDKRVRFALENQTRPIYAANFFHPGEDDSWVIAHELAHQWYGDSVSVHDWKEIWLNEGFATYAEWLWSEAQGRTTAQASFDMYYNQVNLPLWKIPPGDPGVAEQFGRSVYVRGGLTLHALRMTVGDQAFFAILKGWATEKATGSGTTAEFVALAERISGKQLGTLFNAWLYQPSRPPRP